MLKSLKWMIAAALIPAAASAGSIVNTKHDFSSTSTGPVKSSTENQVCKFCHVPHGGSTTLPLIWSHNQSATTAYAGWTSANTFAGTPLPTAAGSITASAARCFACHDGTIAVGGLTIAGTATTIAVAGAGEVDATGKINNALYIVNGGNMAGHHPVSIPYPGSTGSYNGITSGVTAAAATLGYQAINTGAACTSPSGTCVGASGAGLAINLLPATSPSTGKGIECTSCHDVHATVGVAARFLRVDNAGSALCLACHIK